MKRYFKMALAALVCTLALVSCGGSSSDGGDDTGGGGGGGGKKTITVSDLVGQWELTGITTKSVTFGGQSISVYLDFQNSSSFDLYQMIGEGRYTKFSGTFSLSGNVLSGKYSSGKSWGASYEVAIDGNRMTLKVKDGTESDTYTKTTIPSSVTDNIY